MNAIEQTAAGMEGKLKGLFGRIGAYVAGAFAVQKVAAFVSDSLTAFSGFETATTRIFSEMSNESQASRDSILADIRAISDEYNIKLVGVANAVDTAFDLKIPEDKLRLVLAAAAELSKVSGTDLSTATRALGEVITLSGAGYERVGAIADALFQISESTGSGVGQIADQLGKIIPFASAVGVDLDQIAAAMMTMGEQGIPAKTGLSGIQSIIEELSDTSTDDSLGTLFASLSGADFATFMANGGSLGDALERVATWAEKTNTPLSAFFTSAAAGNAAIALTGEHTKAIADNLAAIESGAVTVKSVWGELSQTMAERSADMSTKVDTVKTDLGGMVKAVLDPLNEIATGILSAISGLLGSIVSLLRGDFASAWTGLKQFFSGIYDSIIALFNIVGIGDAINNALVSVSNAFSRWGSTIVASITDSLSSAWHSVTEWFANAWDSLITALTSWMPGFLKKWLGIGEDAGAQYAAGLEASATEVAGASAGLVDTATQAVEDGATDFATAFGAMVTSAVVAIKSNVTASGVEIGTSLMDGLSVGVLDGLPSFTDTIGDAGGAAIFELEQTFGIHSPSRVMMEIGRNLMAGLASGIRSAGGLVQAATRELVDGLKTAYTSMWAEIESGTKAKWESLVSGVLLGNISLGDAVTDGMASLVNGILSSGLDTAAQWVSDTLWSMAESAGSALGQLALAAVPIAIGTSSAVAAAVADANRQLTNILGPIGIGSPTYGSGTWRIVNGQYIPVSATSAAIPTAGEAGSAIAAGGGSSIATQKGGIQVDMRGLYDGATINVRDDQDITRIARETHDLWASRMRARGYAV